MKVEGRTMMKVETPAEVLDQSKKIEPFIFTTIFFAFIGEQDRNVQTNWPGELPRIGETVQLKGRNITWKVIGLQWIFDIEPKEKRFQRAAVITLEKSS